MVTTGHSYPTRAERMVGNVNLRRTAIVSMLALTVISAGCSSGGDEKTARLEAEVAALRDQITTTTVGSTTTTVAPTTTTVRPTTTTTVKRVVATTKPAPTTTTKLAPWCTASAVPASTTKGQLVTILITSNLPGQVTTIGLRPGPTMDPSGSGAHTLTAGGPNMDQYGHYSPKTNTVEVKFYSQPVTLDQMLDGPRPPVLASCSTKYVSMP